MVAEGRRQEQNQSNPFDAKVGKDKNWSKYHLEPFMAVSRITFETILKVFNAISRSILFYGGQVWGGNQ